jgi:hypothetical protein
MSPMSGCFSTAARRCSSPRHDGGFDLNRTWKSFALAIVGAEYVLRWLPRGTHQWDKFVTPAELTHHLERNKLAISDQAAWSTIRSLIAGACRPTWT